MQFFAMIKYGRTAMNLSPLAIVLPAIYSQGGRAATNGGYRTVASGLFVKE